VSPPTLAEVGDEGTQLWAYLELRLEADVSFTGRSGAHKVPTIVTLTRRDQRADPK